MAVDQQFGGNWTQDKLEYVRKYLAAYTTIMNKKNFKIAYIDAFAGTGYRDLKRESKPQFFFNHELTDKDIEKYAEGSARIALQVEPGFSKYIFIEKTKNRCQKLEELKKDFQDKSNKIMLINADANSYITDLCLNHKWINHRAVMFLDPFGMQVT